MTRVEISLKTTNGRGMLNVSEYTDDGVLVRASGHSNATMKDYNDAVELLLERTESYDAKALVEQKSRFILVMPDLPPWQETEEQKREVAEENRRRMMRR